MAIPGPHQIASPKVSTLKLRVWTPATQPSIRPDRRTIEAKSPNPDSPPKLESARRRSR